ncbi:MAG: S8 family peptidase [Elusimicrobia bacterium]|nr:S8 family peptidase [Elusimicrobiota bacterium]
MLKRMLITGWALAIAASTGWAAGITAQNVENRLIVGFRSGVSIEEGRKIIAAQRLNIVGEIAEARLFLVESQPGSLQAAEAVLKANEKVRDVQRDFWAQWIESAPQSLQGVTLPSVESTLKELPKLDGVGARPKAAAADEVQWGVRRVNAPAVWGSNQGQGVKVCIVDTGIDAANPDLQGQVAGGHNAVEEGKPWTDDHFHGTHVGGIVAAKQDGRGVVGVAPKATLYAVKVLNKEGQGSVFSIMGGVNWCTQNKVDVINMSLGAPQEIPFLKEIINMALQAGVTVIAAAGNGDNRGNSGPVGYPAKYEGVIAVSGLDEADAIAKWSSRGPEVSYIAPGAKIPSTVPLSHDASGVKAYSGTSMACPHVAGLAALAVARGARGPAAVKAALTGAAQRLPGLSAEEQGIGLINAANIR